MAAETATTRYGPHAWSTGIVILLVAALLALSLTPPAGERSGSLRPSVALHASELAEVLPLDIQVQLAAKGLQALDGGQDDRGGAAGLPLTLPLAVRADGGCQALACNRERAPPSPLKRSALAPRAPPAHV
ncbi:MAG: hypothetical protein JJU06_03695 [Ectothiorhodospiraceae bacterium]|nr:hypothetical protein [Ectothiorhodospiraceae bacterium]